MVNLDGEVRTTCPYCGVGCGVVVRRGAEGFEVQGDPQHPANLGRLCSKGSALAESLSLDGRLLQPQVNGNACDWDQALGTVAFYVSGQLLTEDYYLANKLMKGFIGSANIDTNSRLCMSSAVAAHKRAFGADTVPGCYEDLERASLVVLTGSNAAWCHPVLYQRLRKAKADNPGMRILLIDPRVSASADLADLHLPIAPGSDAFLFNALLLHLQRNGLQNPLFTRHCTSGMELALGMAEKHAGDLDTVARTCGLEREAIERFFGWFGATEQVVTVFSQGINQSTSGVDKINAIINCHLLTGRIGRPGMGPLSLTGQPNAMGGREVGGLANVLAAHVELDDLANREQIRRFWQAPGIAERPGLKAVELVDALERGEIEVLWVMGTNPAVSLPDTARVRKALGNCRTLIVSDCQADTDTMALADIRLPALTWGERSGTVTNSDRCISRQRPFLPAPGEARQDWWIISQVAKKLGFGPQFDYADSHAVFTEHARLSALCNGGRRPFDLSGLAGLDAEAYEAMAPLRWPVREPGKGSDRLYTDGLFATPDQRARFIAVEPKLPSSAPEPGKQLWLNTGRIRDQWHTMTRTGKVGRLSSHSPEPYVEIHPDDAARLELADGSLARLQARGQALLLRVRVSPGQRPGSLFVPMHWNQQFAGHALVNRLVPPNVDPLSGQPEFKASAVSLRPWNAGWHGFVFSRRRLAPPTSDYWCRARSGTTWRYELAGQQSPEHWPSLARQLLCASDTQVHWMEYFDPASNRYRAARFADGRLESTIFIGPDTALPERDWIASLFEQKELSQQERANLLSGRPPAGSEEQGRVVCSCFGVGEKRLLDGIASGELDSLERIGNCTQAGTNCGSCIPELKTMLEVSLPRRRKAG